MAYNVQSGSVEDAVVPRPVRRRPEAGLSDGRQAQWVDVLGEGADPILELEDPDVGVQDRGGIVVGVDDLPCDASIQKQYFYMVNTYHERNIH